MRILFLINSSTGLYGFRREVVEALSSKHRVFFCSPDDGYVEELCEIGAEYFPVVFNRHGTNPIKELQLKHYYEKVMKNCIPDIVFTYTIKPNVYGGMACAKLGIPYVANITGLGTAVEYGGIMQKITLFLYRLGLKKAKKVFFQNEENRDFMLEHNLVRGDFDMLPGSGVNLDQFHLMDYPEKRTIEFSFISRVMKEKGIDQFLEAAKFIKEKHSDVKFHVCGACEQDYSEELEELERTGIIKYHGEVKDVLPFYELSDCVILPTYYPEGLSNVLLESAACGRPIITTARSGCREVIDDGINGFIVKQRDTKDLIQKIEKFLELTYEEKKTMGIKGREKVERCFDRQIVVKKYINEVESLKTTTL